MTTRQAIYQTTTQAPDLGVPRRLPDLTREKLAGIVADGVSEESR